MKPDNPRRRVIVVGAGIVGVCCALSLRRRGLDVLLLDKDAPGSKASRWNAGVLATSSAYHLCNPETRRLLPRLLAGRMPGFRLHPAAIAGAVPWGARFAAAAVPGRFSPAARALNDLLTLSRRRHGTLLAEAGASHLLRDSGWMWLYRSRAALAATAAKQAVFAQLGVGVEVLDAAGLAAREPALPARFAGALGFPASQSVTDPAEVFGAYLALFGGAGGTLRRIAVRGLARQGDQMCLSLADGTAERADDVVIAAGPWSAELLKRAGGRLPMMSERGYAVRAHLSAPVGLSAPVCDVERGVVLSPREFGVQISTGTELCTPGCAPRPAQARNAAQVGAALLGLSADACAAPVAADRPTLPDCLPAIGAWDAIPGLWLCTGHQHVGFAAAPASGEALADIMTGAPPRVDTALFDPNRFARSAGPSIRRMTATD